MFFMKTRLHKIFRVATAMVIVKNILEKTEQRLLVLKILSPLTILTGYSFNSLQNLLK